MNRVIPAVLAGGVAGTVLRWAVGELEWSVAASLLVVNTVASGVLGMVGAVWQDREHPARLALAVGFCGGLSTFSGLAVELAQQLDRGDPWDAVVLIVASLALGGGAFFGGREVVS